MTFAVVLVRSFDENEFGTKLCQASLESLTVSTYENLGDKVDAYAGPQICRK